ncbi:hypothetical protein ACLKA6_006928 [Drosophila palustris]
MNLGQSRKGQEITKSNKQSGRFFELSLMKSNLNSKDARGQKQSKESEEEGDGMGTAPIHISESSTINQCEEEHDIIPAWHVE